MRILIVEDTFLIREIVNDSLSLLGKCDVVVNGEEAVTAVEHALEVGKPYDLICMDVKMPVMDGTEALKEIRALEVAFKVPPSKEAKVIMITSCDDPKTVVEAYQGGATSYMTKPFDHFGLMQEVRKLGFSA